MAGKSKQKKKRQDTGFLDDYVDVRYAGEPDPVSSNEFTLLINNEEMGSGIDGTIRTLKMRDLLEMAIKL